MIASCTCKNSYQDKKYGKGMRVFNVKNVRVTGDVPGRCSVCGSNKSVHVK